MRLVILKPDDCFFEITNLLSACLLKEANKINVSMFTLAKTIDDLLPNDLVLYRFSSDFQNCLFRNTSDCHLELSKYIQQIENKGCIAFPSSYMLQFYENKKRMYELFHKNGIKFPKTFFVTKDTWRTYISEYTFPLLLKHSFSCSSQGMKQITSLDELEQVLENEFLNTSEVLLQNKIRAKREARLTYFGESIYHGYYRIRKSIDDMSAATSFGSYCDYNIDLQKHKSLIDTLNYTLGISMGGVDILWENDDESTTPYVLEVSPIFEVNPAPPANWPLPYKEWKQHPNFSSKRLNALELTAREYIHFAIQEYFKPRLYVDIDHTICNSQKRIVSYPTEYHKQCYVLQDEPIQSALDFLKTIQKTHTLYFLTARNSYENPFITTRDWLFKHNIIYKGFILCDSLMDKINILSNIDNNISFHWLDDCTVSDSSNNRYIHNEIVETAKQSSIPLMLISGEDSWSTIQLT